MYRSGEHRALHPSISSIHTPIGSSIELRCEAEGRDCFLGLTRLCLANLKGYVFVLARKPQRSASALTLCSS